jgi:hypothetical protein
MRRGRLLAGLAVTLLLATSTSFADEEPTAARRYARGSKNLLFSTELSPLPSVTSHAELDATFRLVLRRGLVLQPRLGIGTAFSAVADGWILAFRAGGAVGYAIPLGRRVALTPMVGYDFFLLWDNGSTRPLLVHRGALELPVTIVVFQHVLIEPFVLVGVASVNGSLDLAFALGPRLGVTF